MHASTHLARRFFATRTRRSGNLLQGLAAPRARFTAQLLGWAIVAALPASMLIALSFGAGPTIDQAETPVAVQPAQR